MRGKSLKNEVIDSILVLDEFSDSITKVRKCKCKCLECGEEFLYTKQTLLKYRHHPHCPNNKYDPSKAIGKKYNEWEVLEFDHKDKNGTIYYKCKCSCGKIEVIGIKTVRNGLGHCRNKVHNSKYDIIGNKYGKLTVLKEIESTLTAQRQFLCKCSCGNEKVVLGSNLIYKQTTSCGCNKGYVENTKINLLKIKKAYSNSKSGIKGVYQDKKGGWHAMITVCKQRIFYYGGVGKVGKDKCIFWRNKMVEKHHKPLIEKHSQL